MKTDHVKFITSTTMEYRELIMNNIMAPYIPLQISIYFQLSKSTAVEYSCSMSVSTAITQMADPNRNLFIASMHRESYCTFW